MASANVEFIRSIFAAWERGDFSSTAWAHPEIEWVVADGPAPGSWKGVARMAEGWRDFVSAWKDYRIVADEYRELDDERVLVLVHRAGRGKASGLKIERLKSRGAAVFHIRGGKVTKQVMYGNRDTVLSELGLTPESDASHAGPDERPRIDSR
jgi:ketosteroid isomerase-like protein